MSYDAKQVIVECQGRGLLELKSWQLLTCHVMEIAKDLRENSPFCMAKLLKLEMFSWELLQTTNIWWHKWRFTLQDEFILSRGYPEYSLRDSRLHLITKKLRQKNQLSNDIHSHHIQDSFEVKLSFHFFVTIPWNVTKEIVNEVVIWTYAK